MSIYNVPSSDKSSVFSGCDFVIKLEKDRKNTPIKLLQITDMQIIDSSQRRTPDRIRKDEIIAWAPENFMAQCGNQISSLISQSKPDLIFLTGDIIYGSFDDKGTTFRWFCDFMDSFEIPWAPVFGNHDNESFMGVDWQCEQFNKSKFCVFRQGNVSGNSNYTVGIAKDNELIRVLHMIDSNGCRSDDKKIIKKAGIYPDQRALVERNTALIKAVQGKVVPAFIAFHIPEESFAEAETAKGYASDAMSNYTLGADVKSLDGDFGFKYEKIHSFKADFDFIEFVKAQNIDGVFVGHCHRICTCINYKNIRFVFGLKTGQYDYHLPGNLGGTLITLEGDSFTVNHLPSLSPYAPMPGEAKIFNGFFA